MGDRESGDHPLQVLLGSATTMKCAATVCTTCSADASAESMAEYNSDRENVGKPRPRLHTPRPGRRTRHALGAARQPGGRLRPSQRRHTGLLAKRLAELRVERLSVGPAYGPARRSGDA